MFRRRFYIILPNCFFSRCDVGKEDDWTILWEHAEAFFNDKVSILVNNAGCSPGLGWKTCIDVMVLGVGFGTFQAIEKMATSKVRLLQITIEGFYHKRPPLETALQY